MLIVAALSHLIIKYFENFHLRRQLDPKLCAPPLSLGTKVRKATHCSNGSPLQHMKVAEPNPWS